MARCNGDSLRAASARGKSSCPVLLPGMWSTSSTFQLVNYPCYNEPLEITGGAKYCELSSEP